eukprot:1503819-Heterocapsa_arctica.AAC.1
MAFGQRATRSGTRCSGVCMRSTRPMCERLLLGEYVDIRAHTFITSCSKMLTLAPSALAGGCGSAQLAKACSTDAGLWLQALSAC